MTNRTSETDGRLTAKGRAMRDRIVQSAAELIFATGARETTLDQVRSAVGASKSQLYHYFGDKDELLRAVIDFQGALIMEAQQPELGAINSIASLKRWRDKLCPAFRRSRGNRRLPHRIAGQRAGQSFRNSSACAGCAFRSLGGIDRGRLVEDASKRSPRAVARPKGSQHYHSNSRPGGIASDEIAALVDGAGRSA